jgi:hypothetical protein
VAHTFRQKSQANAQSGNPITHDHTPGAAATVAILSIVVEGATARTGGAPTIDGTVATQIETVQTGVEVNVEMWYVAKAFSGSLFSVSIPNTNTVTCHVEVVTADAGTGYASELTDSDATLCTVSTCDGFTVSVVSDAAGDFLYSRLGCGEGKTTDVSETSTNPTKILTYSNDHGAYTSFGYYENSDAAGTENFTYVWVNDDGGAIAVCFKSVAGITTYTRPTDIDAILRLTKSKTSDLDAILRATRTNVTDLDAILKMVFSPAFDVDATLKALGLTNTVDLDVILRLTKDETLDLDAVIKLVKFGYVDIDAILRATDFWIRC